MLVSSHKMSGNPADPILLLNGVHLQIYVFVFNFIYSPKAFK